MPAAGAGAPAPQVATAPGRPEPYEVRLEQAQAAAAFADMILAKAEEKAAWCTERAAHITATGRQAVIDATREADAAHARVRGILAERNEQ